jgi:tRNA A-37 threonylcarbamoyl transferase component Bud32
MDTRDVILGNACVERGWLSPEKLADCFRECKGAVSLSSLPRVLLQRRLIPEEELAALTAEIAKLLARGRDAAQDRQEDLSVAQFLRDVDQLTQRHLDEAVALPAGAPGKSPRLREILLEKGYVTLSALEDAVHSHRTPGTPMTCRSCQATSTVARYDPGRVYLCKRCMGEIAPTAELQAKASPAPVPKAESGGEFGKYASPQEIGRGAEGIVYKAWDEQHHRWVALKVIKDSGRLEETARFRREIEIARALHHPNIAAVHEVTHVGDKHLIAMEYIDGRTIAGLKVPFKWSAELVAKISHAVQYAHSRNIIHRDIKPQNIMVDRAGRPYLMDFGLAKSTDTASTITSVGVAMGTPSYMAPEQAIGRNSRVDRRSDIYSLGAVLYDLLTGQPPFQGASPLDTLRKVADEALVPPRQIDPRIPPELERIILKCMNKDRTQRYPAARTLADDLERYTTLALPA